MKIKNNQFEILEVKKVRKTNIENLFSTINRVMTRVACIQI